MAFPSLATQRGLEMPTMPWQTAGSVNVDPTNHMLSPTMLWASTEAVAQLGYREVWYTPFQDKDFDAERLVSMVGQAENGVKPRAAPGAVDGQDPLPCGANK